MNKLNQVAKKFIEGEWIYDQSNNTLKKIFSSEKQLLEMNLIDTDGYLDSSLKSEIIYCLGEKILKNVVGYFGDSDIFSGDILDDETFYNIELHHISDDTLIELRNKFHVEIKKI